MHRRTFALATTALFAATAVRAAPARLVVAELFTSQGCSSCPPADALLTELSQTAPNVLPLAFHVTYWDRLGWRDPFALDAATERQRRYSALWHADEIYTPQLVVDGRNGVVGSDRAAVRGALAAAAGYPAQAIRVHRDGGQAVVVVAAGQGPADILLVGYDAQHRTSIGRGENGGRTLTESNIVRGMILAGHWDGAAVELRHPLPPGEHLAVLLQAPDGVMLGAAQES